MHQIQFGNKKGISVIEVLISSAVLGIALVGILGFASFALKQSLTVENTAVAVHFAEEELEAIRNFRDNTTWNTGMGLLSLETAYYAQKSSTNPIQWQMVQGTETINGFSRTIALSQVRRDINSNIVLSGGSIDANTRKATVVVAWVERGQGHQVQLVGYFTNWRQ